MATRIKTVGVVGTGVIGASWTGLFLSQGLHVLVADPGSGAEEALRERLEAIWPTLEEVGLGPGASIENYRFVGTSLEKFYSEVDFIQENAPERPALKAKLIGEIDAGTRPEVIIASSSSGIPSSKFIHECTKHPERVLIGHPFNPPHLMPLVEVVPHPGSSQQSIKTALELYAAWGKTPVLVKKESTGFAANRLQAALVNEAYSLVANGVLSAKDVDACVTASIGPRWAFVGPLLSGVSGGGGGRSGFRHIYEHLGPAMQVWLKDMAAHQVTYNQELGDIVDKSVQEELDDVDYENFEHQRDEMLVQLFKMKRSK